MLLIHKEQLDALGALALQLFEDELLIHIGHFSPRIYNAADEAQLRKTVRLCITKSKDYGFTYRGPVRLYLELMLLFGNHFDTDPQCTWAAEVLNNRDACSQMLRADLLYRRTMKLLT